MRASVSLEPELRERLLDLSYHGFEECVRELLLALGYQDARLMRRTHWRQRTTNGGFDVAAWCVSGVTTATVLVQVKQYARPVSRRFVDELRGTLLRSHAQHGLIVTLSTFARPAREAAGRDMVAPIRLVDGAELIELLVRHRIGVREDDTGDVGIDTDYFNRLAAEYPARPKNGRLPANHPARALPVWQWSGWRPTGGGMMFRTHALVAVSSLWLLQTVPPGITAENVGYLSVIAVFGAMLPDLDAAESTIRSLSMGGIRPFALLSTIVHRTFGHRGLLHSLVAVAAIGVAAIFLARWWGWQPSAALWLGYASHLTADACTRSGIPLIPGRAQRLHLLPATLRFVTGSVAEDVLLPFLAAAVLLLLLTRAPGA